MNIEWNSTVRFRPFRITANRDRTIVEIIDNGQFYEMEPLAYQAVIMLEQGKSIQETGAALMSSHPDEQVEMLPFIEQLIEMGIIAEIDGNRLEGQQADDSDRAQGMSWIPSSLGKLFYNRYAMLLYSMIAASNIVYFIALPELIPAYTDLFTYEVLSINLLTWLVVSIVLLLLHEAGHVLALRAFDLPARLRIGHRYFLVVMETEMSLIWRLPVRQRNIPYIAGMCVDQLLLFITLTASVFFPPSSLVLQGIVQLALFQLTMMTLFQFMLFMKTDLYYVLENWTGAHNLIENTKAWIWAVLTNGTKSRQDAFAGDERIVQRYALVYLIGLFGMSCLFVIYFIPLTHYMIETAVRRLWSSESAWHVLDSSLILLLTSFQLIVLTVSWRSALRGLMIKRRNF